MDPLLISFLVILSILWFLMYWILGGVFFAVVTIARLGRVRKVRFSCLFTLLAFVLGVGSAVFGVNQSDAAVMECMSHADGKAEMVTAVFGCGFVTIFGGFLVGAVILTIGGFLIMAVSKSKTKPWIVLDQGDDDMSMDETDQSEEGEQKSKFF
jgi:hypothetical protein